MKMQECVVCLEVIEDGEESCKNCGSREIDLWSDNNAFYPGKKHFPVDVLEYKDVPNNVAMLAGHSC